MDKHNYQVTIENNKAETYLTSTLKLYEKNQTLVLHKKIYKDFFEDYSAYLSTIRRFIISFLDFLKYENGNIDELLDINNKISNPQVFLDTNNMKLLSTYSGEIPIYISPQNNGWTIGDTKISDKWINLPPNLHLRLSKMSLQVIGHILDMPLRKMKDTRYIQNLEEASKLLIEVLKRRLEYIVNNSENKVYIAFSGGVDSSLLMKIAIESSLEIIPVTTGFPNSQDIKENRHILKQLGYDGEQLILDMNQDDIWSLTNQLVEKYEVKNKILLPVAVVEAYLMKNIQNGTLIMGQGADELFGGYDKYRRKFDRFQNENLIDLSMLYRTTTLIEWYLSISNNVSITYPYLNIALMILSKILPSEYKVKGYNDYHRKWIIRKALKLLGTSETIYMRRKRAMQYSTGIDKLVKKYIRRTYL